MLVVKVNRKLSTTNSYDCCWFSMINFSMNLSTLYKSDWPQFVQSCVGVGEVVVVVGGGGVCVGGEGGGLEAKYWDIDVYICILKMKFFSYLLSAILIFSTHTDCLILSLLLPSVRLAIIVLYGIYIKLTNNSIACHGGPLMTVQTQLIDVRF